VERRGLLILALFLQRELKAAFFRSKDDGVTSIRSDFPRERAFNFCLKIAAPHLNIFHAFFPLSRFDVWVLNWRQILKEAYSPARS